MADQPVRRGVALAGVVMSLVFLAVASVGFTGDPWWLLQSATKWVLAGLAAFVGIGLLVSSLPGRRRS